MARQSKHTDEMILEHMRNGLSDLDICKALMAQPYALRNRLTKLRDEHGLHRPKRGDKLVYQGKTCKVEGIFQKIVSVVDEDDKWYSVSILEAMNLEKAEEQPKESEEPQIAEIWNVFDMALPEDVPDYSGPEIDDEEPTTIMVIQAEQNEPAPAKVPEWMMNKIIKDLEAIANIETRIKKSIECREKIDLNDVEEFNTYIFEYRRDDNA